MEKNDVIYQAQDKMERSLSAFKRDLQSLRTGQPQPAILQGISVKYYEGSAPISQIGSISKEGPRTLIITPWDEKMVNNIKNAIFESNIGLTPIIDGKCVKVNFPMMTEDARKKLCALVKQGAERTKISIRNTRRDASSKYKSFLKKKEVSADEEKKLQGILNKKVDGYVKIVDDCASEKEKNLLSF